MVNFWRELEFDKFAVEWPLLMIYLPLLNLSLGQLSTLKAFISQLGFGSMTSALPIDHGKLKEQFNHLISFLIKVKY